MAANPTLNPPLANSTLHVVVRIPHPGAPLPDIVAPNVAGLPPGYAVVSESFHATARGTTPDGQQATLVVSQNGVLDRTPKLIGDFGFTAEVVDLQIHGNSSPAASHPAARRAASPALASLSLALASHVRAIHTTVATTLDDPLA